MYINGLGNQSYDSGLMTGGVKNAGGKEVEGLLSGEDEEKDKNKIKLPGKGDGPNGECETCKNRKYQDGSDENVSFKNAAHISPEAAATAVRAHESEHVSNAYTKAAEDDGKVINASVIIQTSVCPECGRTYVSGGVTSTSIKYSNESNPYMKDFKQQQGTVLRGQNVDLRE